VLLLAHVGTWTCPPEWRPLCSDGRQFRRCGDKDVVAMNEECLEGLVLGLGVAEILQIDGRGTGNFRHGRGCVHGGQGRGARTLDRDSMGTGPTRGEDVCGPCGVFHVLALGQLGRGAGRGRARSRRAFCASGRRKFAAELETTPAAGRLVAVAAAERGAEGTGEPEPGRL